MNRSSRFVCIDGFAEELDEIVYKGISNWFVSFRSVFDVYTAHFSYFVVFFVTIACGLLSYRHSVENGRKFTQFWHGAFVHGIISERGIIATKYWHAQAPVMFFGKQLPLHLMFLYPSIYYVSMLSVQRLNLNVCTEPAAVGIIAMLMEIPYRMISVKFLHITYHDSEPLYYSKLCGVPWVEIFSSLVLASSYVAVYHGSQFYLTRDFSVIWDKNSPTRKETGTAILCGFASPIVGFIQKVLLLHVLNDFFNVNPVSCLFLVVSLYFSFVVCFEPKRIQKCDVEDSSCKSFLFYQISVYLLCFMCLAFFGRPENEISIGVHEPTGDCTQLVRSRSPLGMETERKKYLCTSDLYCRPHFLYNFDCVPKGAPSFNSIWYTICGTSFRNRVNFLVLISSFSLFLISIYLRTLFENVLKHILRKILYHRSSCRRHYRKKEQREENEETEQNGQNEQNEQNEQIEKSESEQIEQNEPNEQNEQNEPNEQNEQSEPNEQNEQSEPNEQNEQNEPNEQNEQSEPNEQNEQSEPNEQNEQSEPNEQNEQNEPNEQNEQSEPNEQSEKNVQNE